MLAGAMALVQVSPEDGGEEQRDEPRRDPARTFTAPARISAGIDAAAPRRHTPPTMLDVPPARLRSCAASAIHGPTTSTHHLFWWEPLLTEGPVTLV